jgi:hypothetical protein
MRDEKVYTLHFKNDYASNYTVYLKHSKAVKTTSTFK